MPASGPSFVSNLKVNGNLRYTTTVVNTSLADANAPSI
jgi:uncharacterized repeat protein (TIGR01451 family)